MRIRKIHFVVFAAMAVLASFMQPLLAKNMVAALTDEYLDKFAANNIMFYDPTDCNDCIVSCVGSNGSDVTVLGDSILADTITKQKLKEKLTGLDTGEGNYNSVVGRGWDAGVTQAETMTLKDVVVFEHGTNNSAISADQLNDLLGVIGNSRTLILVTPYSATNASLQAGYNQTAELFKQTANSNQQIKIADWASAAKNANVTLNDNESHVHPSNDDERELLARTIASAIGGSCNSGEAIVSGATAEEKVWSGLISMGFPEHVVAGIMGNMEHEGLMSPAQWQAGSHVNTDWGKSIATLCATENPGKTGVGLVQFTYYKWLCILDEYYKSTAPDLLTILEDPFTYSRTDSGNNYCPGTECFLKKVDDETANRMYSMQLTIIGRSIKGELKEKWGFDHSGVLKTTSVQEAADWWLDKYERPADPEGSRAGRRSDAQKYYDQFHGQSSFSGTSGGTGGTKGTNCNGKSAATAFTKYNFTDGQLRGLLAVAEAENGGSLAAVKNELSVMANLFEYKGPGLNEPANEEGFIHYIRRKPGSESGWFATYDKYNESYNSKYGDEGLAAAKDIYNNGNRVLPKEILEHDWINDITSASNDGTSFTPTDRSKYIKDKTVIKNKYGSTYIFYTWADPDSNSGDPFGYFENKKPDASFSATSTAAATAATVSVDIKWQDGWITSGMDGYVKGTPEMAGLNVTDSAPTLNFTTNRPIDNTVGPNKITLHSTEGQNSVGQYGLDIYQGNPYPPHFTIDMKEKKVYQHFTVDKPAAAVASVDTEAGVQIEIIGFSTEDRKDNPWYLHNTQNFGDEEWKYLAKLLVGISTYTGIKLESSLKWDNPENVRMGDTASYKSYTGVLGHMHTPQNDHVDPGNVWEKLSKAISGISVGGGGSECGETQNNAWTGDFPWYGQCDSKWRSVSYGGCGDICSSGCGCTSFAMMATALTGIEYLPDEVCTYAGDKGMHICGSGSSHSLPATISDHFGLQHETISGASIEKINKYLNEGWMIWTCGSGPDPFTSGGHCIGVRGITSDGKWLLADSKGNGKEVTLEKDWDPQHVFSNMRTFQAIKRK